MQIHVLRITLEWLEPAIWREVAVASDTTLAQLHEVIQIVMDWDDYHLHKFVLGRRHRRRGAQVPDPRVFVPRFGKFSEVDMDGEDEGEVTLAQLCPKVGGVLTYEYDFGDSWEHLVEVRQITAADDVVVYPICLAGARAGPPEDCGGAPGYYRLVEVVADPKHEDHAELVDWLGEAFDPEAFDLDLVNEMLHDSGEDEYDDEFEEDEDEED